MKKKIVLAVLFLGAWMTARAQRPDTARVLVHYKFSHVTDTNNRSHPHTENMVLLVGKTASLYKSWDGMVSDAAFRKAYAEAAAAGGTEVHTDIDRSGASLSTQYYQYPNAQKLLTKDYILVTEYLMTGALPVIDWKISPQTGTFGSLHCQKATGHFKGRDYIVWFCPDLPVHCGPWKLNGLPGVIVDARDTKNEVIFQFDGIEKAVFTKLKPITAGDEKDVPPILRGLDDNPNIIAPPARAIKATQKDFDRLQAGMQKNPNALADGMAVANGASVQTDKVIVKKSPGHNGNNNPIELPEKQ